MLLPFHFTFNDPDAQTNERILEKICHTTYGEVGEMDIYMIEGSTSLKNYVYEYRNEFYCEWKPMDAFHAIEYDDDHCKIDGKIALLDIIRINKAYRNQGMGTEAIQRFIQFCQNQNVNYIILQPSPLLNDEEESSTPNDEEEKQLRLINYYQRTFGFEPVPTKETYPFPMHYLQLKDHKTGTHS